MKIMLTQNDGTGYRTEEEVEEGTSVNSFFLSMQGRGASPEDYVIRVNRDSCSEHQVLHDGDRVSITPSKIDGA